MQRTFLHDLVGGETLEYGALADAVLGRQLRYRPYCRSGRLAEVFLTFAVALTAGRELTLVDEDLTEKELEALGLDRALLRREDCLDNPHPARTLEAWVEFVRAGSGSRITLFTSGSTGLPKAVNHTVASLSRGVRTGAKHATDVWGYAYNRAHIAGVQVFLQALFNLNPLVNLFRLAREQVLAAIEGQRVTHLSATPSFYRLLLPADTALPEVRAVTLGGERTDAALLERLRPMFPNARFRNVYASTEAGTLFSAEGDVFSIPDELTDRVRIQDGRLHVHGELLGEFITEDREAWYDTGDVVEVVSVSPPRFRIVGRDRDWVNVGGNKVNPAEVEAALLEHPGVREARAYGRENSVLGKVLCADVVPARGKVEEGELRRFLADRLQAFKVPRLIRSVPRLELGRTGKLKRDG